MLVYGDRSRSARPTDLLDTIAASIVEGRRAGPRACCHDSLVAALIEAGMLSQGIADAEMQAAGGVDAASLLQAAAMTLVTTLARAVEASWRDEPFDGPEIDAALVELARHHLPDRVEVKQPEGFAYYALYPEAYAAAARGLPAGTRVIGLRSIGTSLAASAAAGAGCEALPLSLRPVGPPFQRHYTIDDELWQRLVDRKAPCLALVDEGPGLSGSSLGALADRLEDAGIAPETMVMLPGHGGDLGPQAAPRHRARWRRVERRLASFETVVLPRLAAAVDDLTGPALAPLEDLSGGGWRRSVFRDEADWPPVDAMQERRKFLLRSAGGSYLLKFVGLGRFGHAALRDAVVLHRGGFGPEALGLRLGFMVSRWEGRSTIDQAPLERSDFLSRLAAYLAFRTSLPPDDASRADLASLAEMTAHNVASTLGAQRAETWRRRYGDIGPLPVPRPVRTDNRLHMWEWIRTEAGSLLKTDGTDHCRAHDLVGCQDIVWDLAGAQVEYDLSSDELDGLVTEVDRCGSTPVSRTLLDWTIPAYLAFQVGLWSMAKDRAEDAERQRIERLLDRYRSGLNAGLPG